MFLLVSVRHVGAHPDELQHGVSIQISINLGKTVPRISRIRIIPSTQIEGLCIFTSFHFPDSGLYLSNGFDFYFDLFWMAWHWKPTIPSIDKWYPFHIPSSLALSIHFNCRCKFTVFKIWITYKNRTFSRLFHWDKMYLICQHFWVFLQLKWQISPPIHILQLVKPLPFHIPEAW